MIPVRKNGIYECNIADLNGEGIGRVEGFTVFIAGALPGERVRFLCIKEAKQYAVGKLTEIPVPSLDRVQPPCPYAHACGGCAYMAPDYEARKRIKRESVSSALKRIGGVDVPVLPTLGMEAPAHYRNKAQYPVGPEGLGFYARRTHRVVPVRNCYMEKQRCSQYIVQNMKTCGLNK